MNWLTTKKVLQCFGFKMRSLGLKVKVIFRTILTYCKDHLAIKTSLILVLKMFWCTKNDLYYAVRVSKNAFLYAYNTDEEEGEGAGGWISR